MKKMRIVMLMIFCLLSGCNNQPPYQKARLFYSNFLQLQTHVEFSCEGSLPESCRKYLPAILYQRDGVPIDWRKDPEMTLPSSAPIDLVSEWGTPLKITTSPIGVLAIEVQLPKEDCPVLTESLSLRALNLSLNKIQIEKSVNGSALKKAKELCNLDLNTVIITI